MAAYRKQYNRKRKRSRLGPLFQFLCGIAVIVALTMGATVFFKVENIEVLGNQRYTQEEVIQATGIQIGDNLFHLNKYAIYDQVGQSLPYIETIQIRRGLPNTIRVSVTEWNAVAEILPNETPEQLVWESDSEPEEKLEPATDSWLISVGGKLLEQANENGNVVEVSGITLLTPVAGTQMVAPQQEQIQENALLALLGELERQGMLSGVEQIDLKSTVIELKYLGRYHVKMPLDCDFEYKLQALRAAVSEREKALGTNISGSFDLTQKNFMAVYSPAEH